MKDKIIIAIAICSLAFSVIGWVSSGIDNVTNGFNQDMNEIITGQKEIKEDQHVLAMFSNTGKAVVEETDKVGNFIEGLFLILFLFILGIVVLALYSRGRMDRY